MDIPVSRLNQRMALQLPSEFPLGMVFVVGAVDGKEELDDSAKFSYFYLVEKTFRIRCLISEHTTSDTDFENGDRIRVGGQMAFDPQQAHYYILAREIEILADVDEPGPSPSEILADIDRRSKETGLAPADLPAWVKQLAPPELMEELGIFLPEEPEDAESVESESGGDGTELFDPLRRKAAGRKLPMSEELLDFLSGAIDSSDDVEITPDVIEHLAPPPEIEGKSTSKPEEPKGADYESDWGYTQNESSTWLADLEAINEVLEAEDAVSPIDVDDDDEAFFFEKELPVSLDKAKPIEEKQEEEEAVELFQDALDTQITIDKNGRGLSDEAQVEAIASDAADEEFLESSFTPEAEDDFDWEELPRASSRKSTIPWPEIAVVTLIVIAVILSVAVIWVIAAR